MIILQGNKDNKYRGIAKKGKRRDVGLLEPLSSSAQEKPVPYMPSLGKQLAVPSQSSTSLYPIFDIHPSGSGHSSRSSTPKDDPPSRPSSRSSIHDRNSQKPPPNSVNSVPVKKSNQAVKHFNAPKHQNKESNSSKKPKKSFDAVLSQSAKSIAAALKQKSKFSNSKTSKTSSDVDKNISDYIKSKNGKNESRRSSVQLIEPPTKQSDQEAEPTSSRVSSLKSASKKNTSAAELEKATGSSSSTCNSATTQKKKKKCGFMRPALPKKEGKSAPKSKKSDSNSDSTCEKSVLVSNKVTHSKKDKSIVKSSSASKITIRDNSEDITQKASKHSKGLGTGGKSSKSSSESCEETKVKPSNKLNKSCDSNAGSSRSSKDTRSNSHDRSSKSEQRSKISKYFKSKHNTSATDEVSLEADKQSIPSADGDLNRRKFQKSAANDSVKKTDHDSVSYTKTSHASSQRSSRSGRKTPSSTENLSDNSEPNVNKSEKTAVEDKLNNSNDNLSHKCDVPDGSRKVLDSNSDLISKTADMHVKNDSIESVSFDKDPNNKSNRKNRRRTRNFMNVGNEDTTDTQSEETESEDSRPSSRLSSSSARKLRSQMSAHFKDLEGLNVNYYMKETSNSNSKVDHGDARDEETCKPTNSTNTCNDSPQSQSTDGFQDQMPKNTVESLVTSNNSKNEQTSVNENDEKSSLVNHNCSSDRLHPSVIEKKPATPGKSNESSTTPTSPGKRVRLDRNSFRSNEKIKGVLEEIIKETSPKKHSDASPESLLSLSVSKASNIDVSNRDSSVSNKSLAATSTDQALESNKELKESDKLNSDSEIEIKSDDDSKSSLIQSIHESTANEVSLENVCDDSGNNSLPSVMTAEPTENFLNCESESQDSKTTQAFNYESSNSTDEVESSKSNFEVNKATDIEKKTTRSLRSSTSDIHSSDSSKISQRSSTSKSIKLDKATISAEDKSHDDQAGRRSSLRSQRSSCASITTSEQSTSSLPEQDRKEDLSNSISIQLECLKSDALSASNNNKNEEEAKDVLESTEKDPIIRNEDSFSKSESSQIAKIVMQSDSKNLDKIHSSEPQQPCESAEMSSNTSDQISSDDEAEEEVPKTRILRGRVIDSEKVVKSKSTTSNDDVHVSAAEITSFPRVCLTNISCPKLIKDVSVETLSTPVSAPGPRPETFSRKLTSECLIVKPPEELIPVFVTDDKTAVAVKDRRYRGQFCKVINLEKQDLIEKIYFDDGKVKRYPLRKSKPSDLETVNDDNLDSFQENVSSEPLIQKDTPKNQPDSSLEPSDISERPSTPKTIKKTKSKVTDNEISNTPVKPVDVQQPNEISSKHKDSNIAKTKVSLPLKVVTIGAKELTELMQKQMSDIDPETPGGQQRSKRLPKASQKLLESFESGNLGLSRMSKLISTAVFKKSKESTGATPDKSSSTATPVDSVTKGNDSSTLTSNSDSQPHGEKRKRPASDEGQLIKVKRKAEPKPKEERVCCNTEFPTFHDLQRHLIKEAKTGDVDHKTRLTSMGFSKCSRCPAYIRSSMMAVHMQNIHHESGSQATKLQLNTMVIKLKKQSVPGRQLTPDTTGKEGKKIKSSKQLTVDLGERICNSPAEGEDQDDSDVENRGKKPALKGILSTKSSSKNKIQGKKNVTLRSPEHFESVEDHTDSDDLYESSSDGENNSSCRKKSKLLKKKTGTIDSFSDRDNYEPAAHKVGRVKERLSEHSFIDHNENSRAQIKTKSSLRSSRRSVNTSNSILNKSKSPSAKNAATKKQKKSYNSSSSNDDSSSSSSSSDDSSTSDSDSSDSSLDDKENIPSVELDMFTFPSNSDHLSLFLMDRHDPKLKLYTNMDSIFVSDVSLGNGKKHASYLTENNNIIYVNHNHNVFPNTRDLANHVPKPVLVMKRAKLGAAAEKSAASVLNTNILRDSNNQLNVSKQNSAAQKVTELLTELINKSARSPKGKVLKGSSQGKLTSLDLSNLLKSAETGNSAAKMILSPVRSRESGSNPSQTDSPAGTRSPISLLSFAKPDAQSTPTSARNSNNLKSGEEMSTTQGIDLLQQIISSTIASPNEFSTIGASSPVIDDEGMISSEHLSRTLSADEILPFLQETLQAPEKLISPARPGKQSVNFEDVVKNRQVIFKGSNSSHHKVILSPSGHSNVRSSQPNILRVSQSNPTVTNVIGSPATATTTSNAAQACVTSGTKASTAQEASQKSAWSFLDDDSDEFLATLEFTDTLHSPSQLDKPTETNTENGQDSFLSAADLRKNLPSLLINEDDFDENLLFDESNITFLDDLSSANVPEEPCQPTSKEASPKKPCSPPKETFPKPSVPATPKSKTRLLKAPMKPPLRTPPRDKSEIPTFISPPSRKRMECFDDSDHKSEGKSRQNLAYSALSDNDIFGLWPAGSSPKNSSGLSPAQLLASLKKKQKHSSKDATPKRSRTKSKSKENEPNLSESTSNIESLPLNSTRISSNDTANETQESLLSTLTSPRKVASPCPDKFNDLSNENIIVDSAKLSPVKMGSLTPKSSKIKLAVSFDDGSIPLEFSLDSMRDRSSDHDPRYQSGSGISVSQIPLAATSAPTSHLPAGASLVMFTPDDDVGCLSDNELLNASLDGSYRKSSKHKEKKSKSKKKKKEKRRHRSPLPPSPTDGSLENKGLKMTINLRGTTPEVVNSELSAINSHDTSDFGPFSALIEATIKSPSSDFSNPCPDPPASDSHSMDSFVHKKIALDFNELVDKPLDDNPESIDESDVISDDSTLQQSSFSKSKKRKLSRIPHKGQVRKKSKLSISRTIAQIHQEDIDDAIAVPPNVEAVPCSPRSTLSPSKDVTGRDSSEDGVISPRLWLGRGAKLRASVLIQDQQVGITDSQVPIPQSPETGKSVTEKHSPAKERRASCGDDLTKSAHMSGTSRATGSMSPPDNRTWISRGAKLKAQVIITDQQSGVQNSEVVATTEKKDGSSFSPNDIRHFFQPKTKCTSSPDVSSSSPTSNIRSFLLPKSSGSPTPSTSSASPFNNSSLLNQSIPSSKKTKPAGNKPKERTPKAGTSTLKEKKLKGDSSKRTKTPSSLPTSKNKKETPLSPRRSVLHSTVDLNIPVTNLKLWYETRGDSIPIEFGSRLTPSNPNFVGFDSLEPFSGARSQTLRHLIALANMKKWSHLKNTLSLPMDQIFVWDEKELETALEL